MSHGGELRTYLLFFVHLPNTQGLKLTWSVQLKHHCVIMLFLVPMDVNLYH